jgi:large subunit ribosomal protein L24
LPKADRIIVEGINLKKKHVKPQKSGEKGQIVSLPLPLHVSNVKIICSKCGKAVKIGYKKEGGKKVRVCKKCGQEI